jgi:hypothetical protein
MKNFVFSLVIYFIGMSSSFAAPIFGDNLIINGNAEAAGAGVPGFTTTGNFETVAYGTSGGFPGAASPGPVDRGSRFFSGGPSNSFSRATQVVDISAFSSSIDGTGVSFALSGFFGGFSSQNDRAILVARFLDGIGSFISGVTIGDITAANRGNVTGLLADSTTSVVPLGARTVSLQLDMTRSSGAYNDGYADNLSLVFTELSGVSGSVPEPASLAIFCLGLMGMKRRKAI